MPTFRIRNSHIKALLRVGAHFEQHCKHLDRDGLGAEAAVIARVFVHGQLVKATEHAQTRHPAIRLALQRNFRYHLGLNSVREQKCVSYSWI